MDVNERISIKITEMLLGCLNDNTKNREEKVNYSINNIINSVEKILILLALFASNRKIEEFFACYVVILLTRTYMGGIHMKTWMGCTIMTILVYICAVEGGCWIDVHSIEICIFIVAVIFMVLIAPIPSPQRPNYGATKKRRLKIQGCIGIMMSYLMYCYIDDLSNYILWVLLLEIIEVICVESTHLILRKIKS